MTARVLAEVCSKWPVSGSTSHLKDLVLLHKIFFQPQFRTNELVGGIGGHIGKLPVERANTTKCEKDGLKNTILVTYRYATRTPSVVLWPKLTASWHVVSIDESWKGTMTIMPCELTWLPENSTLIPGALVNSGSTSTIQSGKGRRRPTTTLGIS